MLTHGPSISLSFAIEEPTACGSLHTLPPLTEAQRLKAIESYALIAASHPVSVKKLVAEPETIRPSHNVPSPVYLRNSAPANLTRLSKSARSVKSKVRQVRKNQSSFGLSLRLQGTFRNYLRLRVPNQIDHPPNLERLRPSRELRQMFANHDQANSKKKETDEVNTIFNRMRNLVEPSKMYCRS